MRIKKDKREEKSGLWRSAMLGLFLCQRVRGTFLFESNKSVPVTPGESNRAVPVTPGESNRSVPGDSLRHRVIADSARVMYHIIVLLIG